MSRPSFDLGLVEPNQVSSQRLSAGLYSLSSRSNVPYVRLQGPTFAKTFSWGEIVEVPAGQQATVYNASAHAGDIMLNGGCEYDNRPARITVPVPSPTIVNFNGINYWNPAYPADVRLARRAYYCIQAVAPAVGAPFIFVVGVRTDGSHNTADLVQPTALGFSGSGYVDGYPLPFGTLIGMWPLGHLANPGNDSRPMTLLTTAIAYVTNDVSLGVPATPNAYYTMEY